MKKILLLTFLLLTLSFALLGQEKSNDRNSKLPIDFEKPIPEFKENPWEHVYFRMVNLIIAVQGDPGSKGFVIFSVTKRSELNSAMKLQKKILKRFNFPHDRILMKIKKGEEYKTDFEFIPAESIQPS